MPLAVRFKGGSYSRKKNKKGGHDTKVTVPSYHVSGSGALLYDGGGIASNAAVNQARAKESKGLGKAFHNTLGGVQGLLVNKAALSGAKKRHRQRRASKKTKKTKKTKFLGLF